MNRALKPLSHPFDKGLREALSNKYPQLVRLSYEYMVFLELGGLRNSPAGYSRVWDAEWSYVIFDLMKGSKLLEPLEAAKLVKEHGLRFVEYKRASSISSVLEGWESMLKTIYKEFEGFVLKAFPPSKVLEKLRKLHHRQYNAVIVKFKHEHLNIHMGRDGKPILPDTEVFSAISRVHMEIGEAIRDKKRAMPLIFKIVREEAIKHNCRPPRAKKIFKLYRNYLDRLG